MIIPSLIYLNAAIVVLCISLLNLNVHLSHAFTPIAPASLQAIVRHNTYGSSSIPKTASTILQATANNNNNDDGEDDGWGDDDTVAKIVTTNAVSSSSTSASATTDGREKLTKERELASLRSQISDKGNNNNSSPSSSSSSNSGGEPERDLFIPIFAVGSLVVFFGLYGYESFRLWTRGELYLPGM